MVPPREITGKAKPQSCVVTLNLTNFIHRLTERDVRRYLHIAEAAINQYLHSLNLHVHAN